MYIRSIASTSWWIKLTIFSAVFTKYVQHSHWTISRKYPEIVLNVQCLMSFPKSVLGQESTYFVICAWIKLPICTRIQVFMTKEGMEKLFSSMHIYCFGVVITWLVDISHFLWIVWNWKFRSRLGPRPLIAKNLGRHQLPPNYNFLLWRDVGQSTCVIVGLQLTISVDKASVDTMRKLHRFQFSCKFKKLFLLWNDCSQKQDRRFHIDCIIDAARNTDHNKYHINSMYWSMIIDSMSLRKFTSFSGVF